MPVTATVGAVNRTGGAVLRRITASIAAWIGRHAGPEAGQHVTGVQRIDLAVAIHVGGVAVRVADAHGASETSQNITAVQRINGTVAVGVTLAGGASGPRRMPQKYQSQSEQNGSHHVSTSNQPYSCCLQPTYVGNGDLLIRDMKTLQPCVPERGLLNTDLQPSDPLPVA